MRKKISLIGAGNIGGTLAQLISSRELADIVLFDIVDGLAAGKALDISQSNAVTGSDSNILGTNLYEDIKDSDVIIVTAGIARKPGMSRDDLIAVNTDVIKSVAGNIKQYAPNAFVIVVTNPLDAMVWVMKKVTGFSEKKVVGMAGILDTSRYNYFLSKALNVSIKDVKSIVLGGHGDLMVPVVGYTTVAGIPLPELIRQNVISKAEVDAILDRTRNGGGEIVGLLKTGSAYHAPAHSALEMAKAYLGDQKRVLPCAAFLSGEYGISGLYIGVPVVIGAEGVEKIIELELTADETIQFKKSADGVQALVDSVRL